MNKIIMLVMANIRKTKGHTVSLLLMFFISALLLNAGMLVFHNFGSFFEDIVNKLNTADIYYIMPNSFYNEEIDQYLSNNDNIVEMQKEEPYWGAAKSKYKDGERERVFLFRDMDQAGDLSGWKFVGAHLPAEDMSIYVPYVFQLDGGYRLNDELEIIFMDSTAITFTIKGFVEDVFFSSPETGPMGVYLPHDTYEKVAKELGDSYQAMLIYANLQEVNKDIETGIRGLINQKSISRQTTDITGTLFSLDLPIIKMSRIMIASMVSVMVVAFAVIIVVVCLIVVRFRIVNSIDDDMTKIGSLKAVGYTSNQIILSLVLQFTAITLAGSLAGIAASYLATPLLSDVFARQSGLKWVQGFDGGISSMALGLLLCIVGGVAFLSSRRIRRIHPIVALRGGIVTHSFRKNHMPLSKSRGSLPVVFAVKSMVQNKKQSIMMAFILVAVSFAQTFAVVMFYNTTIDTTTFLETPGVELSNAIAILEPDADRTDIADQIRSMEGVRKANFIDEALVNIEDTEVAVYIMEDYSQRETDTVYEGRYPIHGNEIALAGHLAEMLGKTIGDTVTVKMGDTKDQYIVTGLSQGAYMGGISSSITYEGILNLNPDFVQQSLNIYLDKGLSAGEFVKKLNASENESIAFSMDMDKMMEEGAGVYIAIVSKIGIVILTVTMAVVILVLYFVINSSVVRRKRELGIQKAIGFTTFQLMNQLSLSFLLPVMIGVAVGSYIGTTQTNHIMTWAQKGMGIMKADYIITPFAISLFSAAIIVISYITSMIITYRIRKISAYALVSE